MSDITQQELERHAKLIRLSELRRDYSLLFYEPFPKQREFHSAGKTWRERLLMAGNQLGKTFCAGNEGSFHATGVYPEWWDGYRLERHNRAWVGGLTSEMVRDGAQRIMLGPVGSWGTGTIPKELILDIKRARGVPDAVETILIRNMFDGQPSQITFKAYSDGREAFQSETLDWGWLDEEPPYNIYTEFITRTNMTLGPVFLTFTPLKGMSSVVCRFLQQKEEFPNCHVTQMTIEDALQYTPEARQTIISQYPLHEREARAKGIPMMGRGRVYQVAEEVICEHPIRTVPNHWKQIIGMDFGWDHPTTAVHLLYDPDADCIHVTRCYKRREALPLIHASAIRPWGDWVPVAWPKDALIHDKGGSCEQLAQQYRDHGLPLVGEYAQFSDKRGNGVEAGISAILERMQTGRFKVDINLSQWWEEFRMYHRKENKDGSTEIAKINDDLLDATRYAVMMLRYAEPGDWNPYNKPDGYATGNRQGTGSWMSS